MEWKQVTRNWEAVAARLKARFPEIDPAALHHPPAQIEALAEHVAERHDLTLYEAHDEVEQILFADSLSFQIRRMAG
ncbi:hypothetical protein M4578_05065 [Salipiger sp. P9]|uniref:hypothetical protein n=1 Tax=Salipiger pentaromativorans TaxID=2943193 RepID=UPI00215893D5|nr:hypothetical protein [Salipiger pentaromativorans]MCR8547187.1 hypothetical protein [Salipiger pentaromativorans]